MKKLYLILLMLLLLFIPTSINAVAIYQLDQPVKELNNHTLREVFEAGNILYDYTSFTTETGNSLTIIQEKNDDAFLVVRGNTFININYFGVIPKEKTYYSRVKLFNNLALGITYENYIIAGSQYFFNVGQVYSGWNTYSGITTLSNIDGIALVYTVIEPIGYAGSITYQYPVFIDLTTLGISSLTVEQVDTYYDLYIEAVRFEKENIQASQDIGGYQNIFRSIINGVKNLISEMGYLWQWLNAPILTSDMRDYQFNIDWSWDLIGVIRQIINSAGVLVMQILFFVPSAMFILTGIPIQVSILSLLFSNLIFLLLGWIMVKSFLI